MEVDERWQEADFGIAEGRTFDELASLEPELADALARGVTDIDWPGGETAAELGARVEAAWSALVGRGRPALVVSHAGPLRHALALARSLPTSAVDLLEPATSVRVEVRSGGGIGPRATLPSVTRRRSSAPAASRPARRRSLPWLLLPVLALFLAAGCIGQDDVRDEASPTPTASVAATVGTPEPSATASPRATSRPDAHGRRHQPRPAAASEEPSPSGEAGSAAACTGTDDNREFFADVAAAFDWPVYCAVLPARWSVESGRYRSAGGGWMEMFYRGPNGARFELHEGAFCDAADGCVPSGTDAGSAAFGDKSGTLVTGSDGRYAVVVDRGDDISWLAIGDGLDVEAFKDLAAALVRVEE